MVTEYNRNTIIRRRMEELERKETQKQEPPAPIVADNSESGNTAETQKPKKTEAEKLSRRKKKE